MYNDCQIHQYLDLHIEKSIHCQHLEICQVSKSSLKVKYGDHAISWSIPYVPWNHLNGTAVLNFEGRSGYSNVGITFLVADWAIAMLVLHF